jgi:hypothetical protein
MTGDPTPLLDDGTYDAFVVDAEATADGGTHLELTITTGEHKGEVLSLASSASMGDPIDLLGMPATITVAFGSPSVAIDR